MNKKQERPAESAWTGGEGGLAQAVPRDASFFRLRTRIAIFVGTFLISLVLQAVVLWVVLARSQQALSATFASRLSSAVSTALKAIGRGADMTETGSVLQRIQESHQMDLAVVVDRENRVIAGPQVRPPGSRVSVFDSSAGQVSRVYRTGRPQADSVKTAGGTYRREYHPVKWDGSVKGVLCVVAYDPVPEGLLAVKGGLGTALGISLLTAGLFGMAILWLIRMGERTRREFLRMERLATAGRLAGSLAHELKNPMSTILLSVQLLLRNRELTEEQRDLLETVEGEVRRSNDEIEAFLDLARDIPLKLREEDMKDILLGTVDLVAAKAGQAGVTIETSVPEEPVRGVLDRRKMRRALLNVLLNAIEAQAGSDGVVTAKIRPLEGLRKEIEVRVRDNGPGMPEDVRRRIGEPFFTTKPNGTGLGLPVTQQIIRQHGGEFHIEIGPGRGTCVIFRLPTEGKEARDEDPGSG